MTEVLHQRTTIDQSNLGRYQITIIALCSVVAMIDGFDTQAISLVAPQMAHDLQIDMAHFGPIFGAGLLGSLIGSMLFGGLADRFGRKPTLLFAVLLFAGASLVTPFCRSFGLLVAIRFITGLGLGGALPSIIAITAEYTPARMRQTVIAGMFCGFPLGAVLGGMATAAAMPVLGWQSIFVAGGVIPLLLLPILALLLPESMAFLELKQKHQLLARIRSRLKLAPKTGGEVTAHPPKASVASLFQEGRGVGTLLLWATLFLSMLLTYFLISWLPLMSVRAGLDIRHAVMSVVTLNIGAILGCLVIGRLADRRGAVKVISTAFAIGSIAIAAIGLGDQSVALLLAATFATGFLSIGAQMCAVALTAAFYDTWLRATGIGWSSGISKIGAFVGPVLGGLLIGTGVLNGSFFLVPAFISVMAAGAVFALRHRMRPVSTSPAPQMALQP
ncbi:MULTISPECIES: aromatic acid/H+ symport family MFS transporter [unclassified Beijerinckia]|uniref:MFS transporter n=1 Tax=unclassified Beijerinckia TaxID=2638183 RepID=UPI000896484C|nr:MULTISPECIES: aromatic acid/H+ symport family MFS transporter [unclassified Beijerinckia]MDH7794763.1 AAHS family 4-hydroxybenzoate transporter-like MFS transporter [Beijerinckia sp. GAS462]SEB74266.1 MFS transporter, AAHS family, 4-hydroxybenzoate transporter [Beijerinckia sp. 28-YEA-48]